jgi:SulP family sulfate permease
MAERKPSHDSRGDPLRLISTVLQDIRNNLIPGVTVALVNVPLSISLGVAADATPEMGIITAVWAGGAAALLGGSHYNVVGPTGALSGMLSIAAIKHGKEVLPLLAIISGLFILVIYFTRMDKLLRFVSASTMLGFTLAVAFTIAANQLNFALGLDKVPRHQSLLANIAENLGHVRHAEWQAVLLFFAFASAQFLLSRARPRVPWAIVMAMAGILLGHLSERTDGAIGYRIRTLGSRYPGLQLRLAVPPQVRAAAARRSRAATAARTAAADCRCQSAPLVPSARD